MNISNVARGELGFNITISELSDTKYPLICLCDHDPGECHPETLERLLDLTNVELDIEPANYNSSGTELSIRWSYNERASSYAADWLFQHRPVIQRKPDGWFDYLVFKAHIADLPDMDNELLYDFYRALKELTHHVRKPRYAIRYLLQSGEKVAFDNSQALPERGVFDPDSASGISAATTWDATRSTDVLVCCRATEAEKQPCPSK